MEKKVYKIEVGDTIIVYKCEVRHQKYRKTFYKTPISKINYDGTRSVFYKELHFKTGTDLPNLSQIKIKSCFEDVRENPKDKFNCIWGLFILDYDVIGIRATKEYQEFEKNYRDKMIPTLDEIKDLDEYNQYNEQTNESYNSINVEESYLPKDNL